MPNAPADESRESLIAELRELLGERCSTAAAVCEQHGHDEGWHPTAAPDAVCFAESTEEVAAIVRRCAAAGAPVIPFGAGTSLEGHVNAIHGGVCIDLSRMDRILEVNAADLDCRVQAGVTRKQLNAYLRDSGLFFPIDPGADASIGGMAATRASGTNAVRYGTMRENVMSLTVVLASGEVIRTGTRARKSSAGYDLTRLLVGSEGSLGVITEIGLKLHGVPEAISSAVVDFPSVAAAVDTVIETIQMGIPIARIELLDASAMAAINAYSKTDYPERDTLFLEFHGSQRGVAEQVEMVGELADEHGAGSFRWATREEDRSRQWAARHSAYHAALAQHPGSRGMSTDACVPISRLAECIETMRAALADSPLDSVILGHVGDGNFHMLFCTEPGNAAQQAEMLRLNELLIDTSLRLGGTCTGEHGIGTGKLKYLRREHGDGAVEAMRAIKAALDPHNLMNPGKTVAC